jgi:hypothetical protein
MKHYLIVFFVLSGIRFQALANSSSEQQSNIFNAQEEQHLNELFDRIEKHPTNQQFSLKSQEIDLLKKFNQQNNTILAQASKLIQATSAQNQQLTERIIITTQENQFLKSQLEHIKHQKTHYYGHQFLRYLKEHDIKGPRAISAVCALGALRRIKNPDDYDSIAIKYGISLGTSLIIKDKVTQSSLSLSQKDAVSSLCNSLVDADVGNIAQVSAIPIINYLSNLSLKTINAWEFDLYYMMIDQVHHSNYGKKVAQFTKFDALPDIVQQYSKYVLAYSFGILRKSIISDEKIIQKMPFSTQPLENKLEALLPKKSS